MNDPKVKFQNLLKELFQFDNADLDFGIYRIMNYKRDAVLRFIEKDLIAGITKELKTGEFAEQADIVNELDSLKSNIGKTFGEDIFDDYGDLRHYREVPLCQRYLEIYKRSLGARSYIALENDIYNHLYSFFCRYYDNGDFISKRRYSKTEKYAIPYNGEEVHLHWANHDQYYIKTGEHFRKYSFKSLDITVRFEVRNANVEQNNVKGDKRYFLPIVDEVTYDPDKHEIQIPFEYRPLSGKDKVAFGTQNQQDSIIRETSVTILENLSQHPDAQAALKKERRRDSNDESVSMLTHHMRQYTARNNSDFFIHKDLKGFLERELDFYIKNEVLHLDEIVQIDELRAEGWFQMLRALKAIGKKIITFLTQIENFQKKLFEKKKFVLETNYCITLKQIPQELYPEIIACEAQIQEWKDLYAIDEIEVNTIHPGYAEPLTVEFLNAFPSLVVDTCHFSEDFKERLLASFDNIDEQTDGLLLHSENFQGLNFLQGKYREKIDCIHIDPPYNTQTSGFLYKNGYQHSSWITMMENRIVISILLMSGKSVFQSHIDENEYELLHYLLEQLELDNQGTVIWDKRSPVSGASKIATQHEYLTCHSKGDIKLKSKKAGAENILQKVHSLKTKYGTITDALRREFKNWILNNPKLTNGEKAYSEIDDSGRVYQSVHMGAPEQRTDPKFFKPLLHPNTKLPCPVPKSGWSGTPEFLQDLVNEGRILFGEDESVQPRRKYFLHENIDGELASVFYSGEKGKARIDSLGLDFPYCHSDRVYMKLVWSVTPDRTGEILDFFAGSGTTAHAVINLNREDGLNRKFILIEMAEYFDTVMLPRIKKVTFTPEWRDGKPKRFANEEEVERSPRIVKYMRLESYEDSLNNIALDDKVGQALLKYDNYVMEYMLKMESRTSETFLNLENLNAPFSYKLHLTNGMDARIKHVDLPETFNYLVGLWVKTRKTYRNGEVKYLIYTGTIGHKDVMVIWRETRGWNTEDFVREREFFIEQKITEGMDTIYVNGQGFIPKCESLDPPFKKKMFEEVTDA